VASARATGELSMIAQAFPRYKLLRTAETTRELIRVHSTCAATVAECRSQHPGRRISLCPEDPNRTLECARRGSSIAVRRERAHADCRRIFLFKNDQRTVLDKDNTPKRESGGPADEAIERVKSVPGESRSTYKPRREATMFRTSATLGLAAPSPSWKGPRTGLFLRPKSNIL
jgi:hypothetical protein